MKFSGLIAIVFLFSLPHLLRAQTTRPADGAAAVYQRASDLVARNCDKNIQCPAASNMTYQDYPPFSDEWRAMEKADFTANTEARQLAHQGRSMDHAVWPALAFPDPDLRYLNGMRGLANELGDAALWQHLQGDDAAAFETLRDLSHLAALIVNPANKKAICLLVSVGIRAMASDRLNTVAAGMKLSKDPHDIHAVQMEVVQGWINEVLKHPDPQVQTDEYDLTDLRVAGQPAPKDFDLTARQKFLETCRRVYADCDLSAMSLACHLYQFDNGRWPARIEDLHAYLPIVPLDPWGDGKQTLGYALIKGGLPDGSDRPVVYSRYTLDGTRTLFCRTDQPFYSYYSGDGSNRPWKEQQHGGQFRDVAAWAPPALMQANATPTTQPIN